MRGRVFDSVGGDDDGDGDGGCALGMTCKLRWVGNTSQNHGVRSNEGSQQQRDMAANPRTATMPTLGGCCHSAM